MPTHAPAATPRREFVALVALLTSLVALSIDAMLPAIGTIASELGARGDNARQYVLLVFLAAVGAGQLVYGPLSDAVGRKPAILLGLGFYLIGSVLCLVAGSFEAFLVGRAIQGFGASGPRTVAVAMVRDGQAGAAMARVMSMVMTVFIIVPVIAPTIGQMVLWVTGWRTIFGGFLAIALAAGTWLALRQPETLPPERRTPAHPRAMAATARQVVAHRVTVGYMLGMGFLMGAFLAYLASSQQVFVQTYDQGEWFAVWFGVLAIGIGVASAINARLVTRFGMRRIVRVALPAFVALSVAFLGYSLAVDGRPSLAAFAAYLIPALFCNGFLFGNFNALAMEPMGSGAGMAASIIGIVTSVMSVTLAILIGQAFDGTVLPLVIGFAACGVAAWTVTAIADRPPRR
jgi:DHA1 family bicyclomycin/chloramphenicol resistance-like MFS transporter